MALIITALMVIIGEEDACYVFTESQIDLLEDATNTLHHMYVQAVAHVVKLAIMQDLALMISPLSS